MTTATSPQLKHAGMQPTSWCYAMAVHKLDCMSMWKLGTTTQPQRTMEAVSPWATYEGHVLHDLVAKVHRRKASSISIAAFSELEFFGDVSQHSSRYRDSARCIARNIAIYREIALNIARYRDKALDAAIYIEIARCISRDSVMHCGIVFYIVN